ncbi:hypothetical protein CspeluHIS016_0800420 [Cutaneotrichosporon spelunceum]|uniref:Pyridoxamine 5'-phosphate oxidase Alr4036 family FMN-binding domain-containing protein n=1 Tax=Cutaneotrichosporon spelunceum TaxID=1672016 RepID=A0AAD3YDS2_9TREE|nr:hypothetical protein CspeluHIS016_0800420 [Cutaneotrichosporon spelunceum]
MVPRASSISRAKPEWQQLLESELAQNPRSTVYSLATVHEGAPRVRSVVHRGFSPSGLLLSTTDLRMPKATQLGAEPRTEIAWLLPTLVQFRVTGRAYIVPASGSGNLSRRGSQVKISPSYSSPRNPPPLRRTPSVASANSSLLGVQATPLDASEDVGDTTAVKQESISGPSLLAPETELSPTDAPETKGTAESLSRPGSPITISRSNSTKSRPESVSRPGSPITISRSNSTKGRPRLHLTPIPGDLGSASPSSPLGSGQRSPHLSPPLSASSTGSCQFRLRPNAPLNPAVTLEWEDIGLPKLAGTLSALVSWGVASTAPESSPSWWDAERTRLWDSLSPALRATFARPAPPGSTLTDAPDPSAWVKRLEPQAQGPEEAKSHAEAWQNFAVVALAPERVEMLELACDPHRRVCWVRDGETWVREDLVP